MTNAVEQEPVKTIGEVSQILGTDPYTVRYLLVRGKCPDVPQLAGQRIFTASDIHRVRKALEDTHETVRGGG